MTIAGAYVAKHQVAAAIFQEESGDNFQQDLKVMHFGVRGNFVATAQGVCSIETYTGDEEVTPEFLENRKLK